MSNKILDFVAIGVGPFNLGLACLTANIEELNCVFLDKNQGFDWHPGMLLQDTTLQVPFMADLVTLADPTNPFSFLNYIKEQGRIYSFYIRENFLLLRNEYNQYCQWAIQKLSNVHFGIEVIAMDYQEDLNCYVVTTKDVTTKEINVIRAKKIVLGTGTQPYVPSFCNELMSCDNVLHSSRYLNYKEHLQTKKSITVVGSGQSAAEIFYDLLQEADTIGYALNWITRSPRFFPLEYSKLTLEMTSPEYVDYFYNLSPEKRDDLIKNQKHLYKGINQDLINEIHNMLYAKRVVNRKPLDVELRTNAAMQKAVVDLDGSISLEIHQVQQDRYYKYNTEAMVLATGYSYRMPDFIHGVSNRILWDNQGRFDVNRNYSIDKDSKEIFVQNVELHTHGFVTPDLGMACYRNSYIIKEITGTDYYPIEQKIAFQKFGVTSEEEILQDSKSTI